MGGSPRRAASAFSISGRPAHADSQAGEKQIAAIGGKSHPGIAEDGDPFSREGAADDLGTFPVVVICKHAEDSETCIQARQCRRQLVDRLRRGIDVIAKEHHQVRPQPIGEPDCFHDEIELGKR